MNALELVKKWISEVVEISLLLVALGITIEILFGSSVPFFGGVVNNLMVLIGGLGENGLVGLIALAIILWLFYRRQPIPQHHQ